MSSHSLSFVAFIGYNLVMLEDALPALIGESRAMRRLLALLGRLAPLPLAISLTGESGTGKDHAARWLHHQSKRAGAFISVNAPRLDSGIAESVVFGHAKGSFTGAYHSFAGLFMAADRGTVFLNEIHRLKPEAQGLLLEPLDGRPYRPLSSEREVRPDVRLLVGSPVPPRDIDPPLDPHLLYRLGSLLVRIPPLRERMDDLEALLGSAARRFAATSGVEPKRWEPPALELMKQFNWPGNVRQLFNVSDAATVLAPGDTIPGDVVADLLADEHGAVPINVGESLAETVRRAGSHEKAAKLIGVSTKTIQRRLRESGVTALRGNGS